MAVTVSDGTDPIQNVDVVLEDSENHQYTGKTGSAGGCNITDVPEGTYSVAATCSGYTDYASSEDVVISEENKTISITMTAA